MKRQVGGIVCEGTCLFPTPSLFAVSLPTILFPSSSTYEPEKSEAIVALTNFRAFLRHGKKIKYEKGSAMLSFLVHTVLRGTALIRNGALLRDTALISFFGKQQIVRKKALMFIWKGSRRLVNGHAVPGLFVDLSWPERTAKQSSTQNLEARSFVWRNCAHTWTL